MAHVVGPVAHAGVAILSAFGGDAVGAVLGAGAAPFGHHRGSVTAILSRRVGFRCRHAAGGQAQAGKQQRAARCGDISLPRRRFENHCPVGQLLITPPPEGFDQVMRTAVTLQVADKFQNYPLNHRVWYRDVSDEQWPSCCRSSSQWRKPEHHLR
jgi:hypothetical protein